MLLAERRQAFPEVVQQEPWMSSKDPASLEALEPPLAGKWELCHPETS